MPLTMGVLSFGAQSGGWDQVCAKLVRGRVQPMILLFETPRAAHMTASRAIAEQMLPHTSSSVSQVSLEAALAQVPHSQAAADM